MYLREGGCGAGLLLRSLCGFASTPVVAAPKTQLQNMRSNIQPYIYLYTCMHIYAQRHMHMDQMKACRTHANMPCVLPCMPIDMSARLDNKIRQQSLHYHHASTPLLPPAFLRPRSLLSPLPICLQLPFPPTGPVLRLSTPPRAPPRLQKYPQIRQKQLTTEHTPTRLSPALTVSEASPPLARSALENCTESVNSTPSSSESSGSLSSTTASWFAPSLASVCGASATRQLAASKKADAPAHNPRRCRPRLADTITQKSSA